MHNIDRKVLQTTLATALLIAGMYVLAPDFPLPQSATPTLADGTPVPSVQLDQAAAPSS